MTTEEKIAYINSQTACMLAELEGMKAANADRAHQGDGHLALAYDEKAFMELPVRYGLTHNHVLQLLNRDY